MRGIKCSQAEYDGDTIVIVDPAIRTNPASDRSYSNIPYNSSRCSICIIAISTAASLYDCGWEGREDLIDDQVDENYEIGLCECLPRGRRGVGWGANEVVAVGATTSVTANISSINPEPDRRHVDALFRTSLLEMLICRE